MTTDEILSAPRIPTKRGSIALSSIRPGDWLRGPTGMLFVVLVNSAKLRRAVLQVPGYAEDSYDYDALRNTMAFIGNTEPRLWWTLLPRFLRKSICPFPYPTFKKPRSLKK